MILWSCDPASCWATATARPSSAGAYVQPSANPHKPSHSVCLLHFWGQTARSWNSLFLLLPTLQPSRNECPGASCTLPARAFKTPQSPSPAWTGKRRPGPGPMESSCWKGPGAAPAQHYPRTQGRSIFFIVTSVEKGGKIIHLRMQPFRPSHDSFKARANGF